MMSYQFFESVEKSNVVAFNRVYLVNAVADSKQLQAAPRSFLIKVSRVVSHQFFGMRQIGNVNSEACTYTHARAGYIAGESEACG